MIAGFALCYVLAYAMVIGMAWRVAGSMAAIGWFYLLAWGWPLLPFFLWGPEPRLDDD